MFQTIDPATGEVVRTYEYHQPDELHLILNQAQQAFSAWKQTPMFQRSQALKELAMRLREHKGELAALMAKEMGKKHDEGNAEIEKCAATCEYFAVEASEYLKARVMESTGYSHAEVRFEPLGVILSIMPWNFPFWQFTRFAVPSLMVGNTILLKHSDLTTGCGAKIEELCRDLFPLPLVQQVRVDHDVAATLIHNPVVRGVTFTGSARGGREVGKEAGMALKKSVLELGGSDAYVILPDADLALAAKICAAGRMINNGQSCVAAKRFIILEDVYENFLELFKKELSFYPTAVLAAERFQKQLQVQVDRLVNWGGKVLLGGKLPSGPGAFYPPSLISFENSRPELHHDEIFGPVALAFRAESIEHAFELANASPYGLGGGVFSKDELKAQELAARYMESGMVVVNDFVKSEPRLPFGGVKDSGYGRELSLFSLQEFCNLKSVVRGKSV